MKKSHIILAICVVTFFATCLTLYLAYVGTFGEPFSGLFIVIEGSVITGLIFIKVTDWLKEPAVFLTPISKNFDIGFYVRVKEKNIKDAEVYCDDTRIKWREDGKEKKTKDLYVGGEAFFFPYKFRVSEDPTEIRLKNDEQSIYIEITQKTSTDIGSNETTERITYWGSFVVPRGRFTTIKVRGSPMNPNFHCNIRLIGKGIEEVKTRLFDFTCTFWFTRDANSDKKEDIWVRCDFGSTESLIL